MLNYSLKASISKLFFDVCIQKIYIMHAKNFNINLAKILLF